MSAQQHSHQPSGFSHIFGTTTVRSFTEDGVLYVGLKLIAPPSCCGTTKIRDYRVVELADVPTVFQPVKLRIEVPRVRCDTCRAIRQGSAMEFERGEGRKTSRLVRYLQEHALAEPTLWVARRCGLSTKTVQEFADRLAKILEAKVPLEAPRILGIDEVHITGKARAVFVDLSNSKASVIDMTESYATRTVAGTLLKMRNLNACEVIVIDMCSAYRKAIRETVAYLQKRDGKADFNPAVVVDKRHVLELVRGAMEGIRREIKLPRGPKKKILSDDGKLLNMRKSELDEFQIARIEGWRQDFPLLIRAWERKEALYGIYECPDRAAAERWYDIWAEEIPEELKKAFSPVFSAFKNWRKEIFAYFDFRDCRPAANDAPASDGPLRKGRSKRGSMAARSASNGPTEAINGLIKMLHRRGRGYNFERLRARVLFVHGSWNWMETASCLAAESLRRKAPETAPGSCDGDIDFDMNLKGPAWERLQAEMDARMSPGAWLEIEKELEGRSEFELTDRGARRKKGKRENRV